MRKPNNYEGYGWVKTSEGRTYLSCVLRLDGRDIPFTVWKINYGSGMKPTSSHPDYFLKESTAWSYGKSKANRIKTVGALEVLEVINAHQSLRVRGEALRSELSLRLKGEKEGEPVLGEDRKDTQQEAKTEGL